MGKHPNHPQISPELTAKPHTRAASTEGLPRQKLPLLTHGLEHLKGVGGREPSRAGWAEGPFPSPQHVWPR